MQKFPYRTLQVKPGQKLDHWGGSREVAIADPIWQDSGSPHAMSQTAAADPQSPASAAPVTFDDGHHSTPAGKAAANSKAVTSDRSAEFSKPGQAPANPVTTEQTGPSTSGAEHFDGALHSANPVHNAKTLGASPFETAKPVQAVGSGASHVSGEAQGGSTSEQQTSSLEALSDVPRDTIVQFSGSSGGDPSTTPVLPVGGISGKGASLQGGLDGYFFGDLYSGQTAIADFAPAFTSKGLPAAQTEWAFPAFTTSFDALDAAASNAIGSSLLSVSLGGVAFAAGHETATSGLIEAKVTDLGPVTVAKGVVQFAGAAQNLDGSQAVAGADSYAELTGADFVLTFTTTRIVIDGDSMLAVSTTRFWGVDIEGWSPAGGSITNHLRFDSVTVVDGYGFDLPVIGNIADSRALTTAIGGDTLADVMTSSLVRAQELSIVTAQAHISVA